MPTDILANAKKFRESIGGLTRAQQVGWFRKELGLDESQILRLLGYKPADIVKRRAAGATVEELAAARPEKAIWVSELFRELADRSGYDINRLREFIRRSGAMATTAKTGSPRRPGVGDLLRSIDVGGPDVYDNLALYLGGHGRSGNGKRKKSPPHA
jgi:hypothetical protein